MPLALFAKVIEVNLTGVFNACHVTLPHMRRRGAGFGSVAGPAGTAAMGCASGADHGASAAPPGETA